MHAMRRLEPPPVVKPTIVVYFLIPKVAPGTQPPTRENFSPEKLPLWTVRLPVVLPTQLAFRYAVNVARFRLGLPETYRFYFNCLPEHQKLSGLRAVRLNLASTPENEAMKPGARVPVFVEFAPRKDKFATATEEESESAKEDAGEEEEEEGVYCPVVEIEEDSKDDDAESKRKGCCR